MTRPPTSAPLSGFRCCVRRPISRKLAQGLESHALRNIERIGAQSSRLCSPSCCSLLCSLPQPAAMQPTTEPEHSTQTALKGGSEHRTAIVRIRRRRRRRRRERKRRNENISNWSETETTWCTIAQQLLSFVRSAKTHVHLCNTRPSSTFPPEGFAPSCAFSKSDCRKTQ
jgi:hypothetical protein